MAKKAKITLKAKTSTKAKAFDEAQLPRGAASFLAKAQKSFATGKHCDATIICGARRWKVDSFVLAHQSDVFERMLHGGFKVRGMLSCNRKGEMLMS